MSNDLVPPAAGDHFLDHLHLPKLIAGPAGEALARLIGGAADIPAAWMQQVAQGVRDKTEAKSVVSKAVADAAANLARNDPEIIKRAAHSLLSKEIRQQANRESIARKTITLLQTDETGSPSEELHHKVDDDWLNIFQRLAGEASSDRLQSLWARVLNGEIRHPKAFSLQTLRFVSELDEEIAAAFEVVVPSVLDGEFIPYPPKTGSFFDHLLFLEEAGLVSGAPGILNRTVDFPKGLVALRYKSHTLILSFEAKQTVQIPSVLLTRVGKQIYSITQATDAIEEARRVASALPKENISHIFYSGSEWLTLSAAERGQAPSPALLWAKPPAPAAS